jgi:hypothetical protein
MSRFGSGLTPVRHLTQGYFRRLAWPYRLKPARSETPFMGRGCGLNEVHGVGLQGTGA